MNDNPSKDKKLKIELSYHTLALLFESGLICAADIRCLTTESKQQVSQLCLSTCAKRITCNIALFGGINEIRPQSTIGLQSIKVKKLA